MTSDEAATVEVILHLLEEHERNLTDEINNAHDRQTHIRVSRLAYEAQHLTSALRTLTVEE